MWSDGLWLFVKIQNINLYVDIYMNSKQLLTNVYNNVSKTQIIYAISYRPDSNKHTVWIQYGVMKVLTFTTSDDIAFLSSI